MRMLRLLMCVVALLGGFCSSARAEDAGQKWAIQLDYKAGAPDQCPRELHNKWGPKQIKLPYKRRLEVSYDRVMNPVMDIHWLPFIPMTDVLYLPAELLTLKQPVRQAASVELLLWGLAVPLMPKIDIDVDGIFTRGKVDLTMRMPLKFTLEMVGKDGRVSRKPAWCTLQYSVRSS